MPSAMANADASWTVMLDFYHQRATCVCTTIVESGIDAVANTIIIDAPDKLGLAQLHQLRGRGSAARITRPMRTLLTPPRQRD
jgi:transcription-repair coupling factor (superfamily II helicase)